MSNADIAKEFVRLCREGSKEQILAFHSEHQQKVPEEIDARSNRSPKKEN